MSNTIHNFTNSFFINLSNAYKVYSLLNGRYINSFFQLFNVEFITNLRTYFYEHAMLRELNSLTYYQNSLVITISPGIVMLAGTINFLDIGWHKNVVCKDGILFRKKVIYWHKIIDYRWVRRDENNLLGEQKYHELILTLRKHKRLQFLNYKNEVILRVNDKDKIKVDSVLEKYIIVDVQ